MINYILRFFYERNKRKKVQTINFLTSHFIPENTAATNRVSAYVKELEKFYKINVFALTEKGVKQPDKKILDENVTIYYINQSDFNQKNFIKRAINEIKHLYKLIKLSKNHKADLTIATAPYMFMIPLTAFLISGRKIIDIRDLVWEYLPENSFFNKTVKKILSNIMILSLKRYNFIVVTNKNEKEWIKKNIKEENLLVVSNGIEKEKFKILSSLNPKPVKPFTVTYVGNIGIAQNLKILLEAAKERKDINFNIIGSGAEYKELKDYAKKNDINNITFWGKKSWEEILEFYEKSSVLYAQLDEKFKSAMPSKLYEYASTGLPIIYGGVGEAAEFVKKLENAINIAPNNKEELIKALDSFEKKQPYISEKNREFIKNNFIRENESKKLVKVCEILLREGRKV